MAIETRDGPDIIPNIKASDWSTVSKLFAKEITNSERVEVPALPYFFETERQRLESLYGQAHWFAMTQLRRALRDQDYEFEADNKKNWSMHSKMLDIAYGVQGIFSVFNRDKKVYEIQLDTAEMLDYRRQGQQTTQANQPFTIVSRDYQKTQKVEYQHNDPLDMAIKCQHMLLTPETVPHLDVVVDVWVDDDGQTGISIFDTVAQLQTPAPIRCTRVNQVFRNPPSQYPGHAKIIPFPNN